MGNSQSYPGLTEDLLEEYVTLTYLTKGEILLLMKKFFSIDPAKMTANPKHRFSKDEVLRKFDVLKTNPFQDRIFRVFSSKNDDCFSFEDMLDLYSVMSYECPPETKAVWAFRIYDIDEDNHISEKDLFAIIDRLTNDSSKESHHIDSESKTQIAKVILDELRLDCTGSIGVSEFKIMMCRIPEFSSSFYFRL